MPASNVYSGLLRGFGETTRANRAERTRQIEAQIDRDQRIFEMLATSDDPEIAHGALAGLESLSIGTYEPKKGLARFLGGDMQANPAVARVFEIMRSPEMVGAGFPVRAFGVGEEAPAQATAPPAATRTQGAAMPAQAASEPGGGPPSPAALGSPVEAPGTTPQAPAPTQFPPGSGPDQITSTLLPGSLRAPVQAGTGTGTPAAPATPATAAPEPQTPEVLPPQVEPPAPPPSLTGFPVKEGQPFDTTTGRLMGVTQGTPVPRQVFLRPEQRVARDVRAREDAENQAELRHLRTLFTDEEIRELMRAEAMGSRGRSGFQAQRFEIPDGQGGWTQIMGTFDPQTGVYRDLEGNIHTDARPLTSTGSSSLGTAMEAAAGAHGWPNAAAARAAGPEAFNQVIATAQTIEANRRYATTFASGEAGGDVPLSTQQRFQATTGLQDTWRKVNAPVREMERQMAIMETSLTRFKEGDRIGGSEGVIATFKKVIDPESVVREAEYNRTPDGLGWLQRIRGQLERIGEGGAGVPLKELEELVETGRAYMAAMQGWSEGERDRLGRLATSYELDPSLVFGSGVAGAGVGEPSAAQLEQERNRILEGIPPPAPGEFDLRTLDAPPEVIVALSMAEKGTVQDATVTYPDGRTEIQEWMIPSDGSAPWMIRIR